MSGTTDLNAIPTAYDHAVVGAMPSGMRTEFGLRMRALHSKIVENQDVSVPGKQMVQDFQDAGGTQEQWNALIMVATQDKFSL